MLISSDIDAMEPTAPGRAEPRRRRPVSPRALLDRDDQALARDDNAAPNSPAAGARREPRGRPERRGGAGPAAAEMAAACCLTLRALDAHDAALDLALGQGLDRLFREFGVRVLGHARAADFAPARLGLSLSHVKELRGLARALASLPLLRRAFLSGDLSRSRLRLVARVATPETEAGWLVLARRLSTRALEAEVRRYRRARTPAVVEAEEGLERETDPEAGVRVSWHATAFDAALFRSWGRAMASQLMDRPARDADVAEMLAAETLTVLDDGAAESEGFRHLGVRVPRRPGPAPDHPHAADPVTDAQLARLARRLRRLLRGEPVDLGLPDVGAPKDAWSLLEVLGDLVAERHGAEAERARLLALVSGRGGYRHLGFRTFDDFTQHALGLAPREASELVRLDDRLLLLPLLREAWLHGCVSRLTASLLSRVAERATEEDWLDWAGRVSFKRLELEVEWHLALRASVSTEQYLAATGGRPRRDASTRELRLDWRAMFGSRARVGADGEEGAHDGRDEGHGAAGHATDPGDGEPWDSVERATIVTGRRVRVSFTCSPEVAALLERAVGCVSREMGGLASTAECIRWMLFHVAATHASPEHEARWAQHPILERDGRTCSMPHCRSVGPLQVHHLRERSRGGPLEPWNEAAECDICHLGVVHAGHARTRGRAPGRVVVTLGTSAPGGGREAWRDEVLVWRAPRRTPRWSPSSRGGASGGRGGHAGPGGPGDACLVARSRGRLQDRRDGPAHRRGAVPA